MALPPIQIYQLEDELEKSVSAWLLANGVNEVAKQRDSLIDLADGTKATLKTPRVESKATFTGGAAQNEHYFIVPQTNKRWLDIYAGTLYLKIVTRRDVNEPSHAYLRGLCRYLMQQVQDITAKLQYHKIEKMIEQACAVSVDGDRLHDVSALSFNVWMRIRPEYFPTS